MTCTYETKISLRHRKEHCCAACPFHTKGFFSDCFRLETAILAHFGLQAEEVLRAAEYNALISVITCSHLLPSCRGESHGPLCLTRFARSV